MHYFISIPDKKPRIIISYVGQIKMFLIFLAYSESLYITLFSPPLTMESKGHRDLGLKVYIGSSSFPRARTSLLIQIIHFTDELPKIVFLKIL